MGPKLQSSHKATQANKCDSSGISPNTELETHPSTSGDCDKLLLLLQSMLYFRSSKFVMSVGAVLALSHS